jgi:hypothetical protein
MQRVRQQAASELKGFLEEDESTSPVARRIEEPRAADTIPVREQINYCDDLLGKKLEVFKQIKQRFEISNEYANTVHE